jgi:type III secretion protein V
MGEKRFQVCGTLEQIESIKENLSLEFDLVLGRYNYYCEPTLKPILDELGIKHITYEKRWAKMIETLLVSKSKDFFSLNDVQKHLNKMNETHGEMIKELVRVMPAAKSTDVLQRLLTEQVSIRNMNTILASLIDWGQRERDPIIITEQVRRALFEQITHQHLDGNVLKVLSLDNELEQFIRENLRSDGSDTFVDIDSTSLSKIIQMISLQYKEWAHCEHLPVAVCSMDVRPHFRALIQDKLKAIPVMSYQEISANRELQFLGSIRFDESLLEQDNNQGVENQ